MAEIILNNLESDKNAQCYWFDGEWHTRGDLLNLVNKSAETLKNAGFTKGQRLVVMMKNSPLIPALSLAVWKLGGAICPLNEKAGNDALKHTLELLKPFTLVISPEAEKNIDPEILKSWPSVICENELKDFTGKTNYADSEDENFAVIFSTSGTTGKPKAVPLTHTNLISNCEATSKHVHVLNSDDVFLNALPNFHSFGYTCTMMLPLSINAKIATVPSFLPPSGAIRAILEANVTTMYIVPAMLSYLVNAAAKNKMPVDALKRQKFICTGGDKLSAGIRAQAVKLFGRDIICEGYGLTETTPVVCMNRSTEENKPGTVGPLLPGYEFKLKTRDGQLLNNSNEGVLWVRGNSVTPGYYHAPEITRERFDDEKFFNTGDYVKIDEDGYYTILDRVTDIIIVSGFNVYPQEVERVLTEHPAVQTAIVVGMPHDTNGEIPEAYIQRREGFENVSEREIIKFAKERLAHFKVPRKVEFVDDFPLSSTGKILRRVLREKAGRKSL